MVTLYNIEHVDSFFFRKMLPIVLKSYDPWRITYKNQYDLCPVCLTNFKKPVYQFCYKCKNNGVYL